MNINNTAYRTLWVANEAGDVELIDQTRLPWDLHITRLQTAEDAWQAIATMQVRGAPLIGVTAAYGVALAMRQDSSDTALQQVCQYLLGARPTAVNLRWALDQFQETLSRLPVELRQTEAYRLAGHLADEDVATNRAIGDQGLVLIQQLAEAHPDRPINIMTHCNAGWLATVDWGTATAPIYRAHDAGIPIHVWVDETRPRNQGASLTAFELAEHGVPHTVVVDNTGGYLMQTGQVDLCIVGTDRTTVNGDVVNKIGTYLKALAAHDNGVPFYVALPSSSIDWQLCRGCDVPIEQRGADEVTHVRGRLDDVRTVSVRVVPETSTTLNIGFDVTPARLISGLITERGITEASRQGLAQLFGDR